MVPSPVSTAVSVDDPFISASAVVEGCIGLTLCTVTICMT